MFHPSLILLALAAPLSLPAGELPADAHSPPNYSLTPAEAADLAGRSSWAVRAAIAAETAAIHDGQAQAAFMLPQVGLEARRTRYYDRPSIPGATPPDDETSVGVQGELLIWSFGRHCAAWRRIKALREAANADTQTARRDAAFRAAAAVEAVRFAKARTVVAADRLEQRQGERQDVQKRKEAGTATDLDVRQAEAAVLSAENEVAAAREEIARAEAELVAALALEAGGTATASGDLARPTDLADLRQAATTLIANGPETAALDARQRELQANMASSLALYAPELFAQVGLSYAGSEADSTDEFERTASAGLVLRWNLFDGGALNERRRQMAALQRQLRYQCAALIAERQRTLQQILTTLDTLGPRIERAHRIVELAQLNYTKEARLQYLNGVITITRLGEASLAVAEARFGLLALIYSEALAAHQLRMLAWRSE